MTYEEAEKELAADRRAPRARRRGLDEALELWERGEELYRFCAAQLDTAEGKIEELAQRVDAARPAGKLAPTCRLRPTCSAGSRSSPSSPTAT